MVTLLTATPQQPPTQHSLSPHPPTQQLPSEQLPSQQSLAHWHWPTFSGYNNSRYTYYGVGDLGMGMHVIPLSGLACPILV